MSWAGEMIEEALVLNTKPSPKGALIRLREQLLSIDTTSRGYRDPDDEEMLFMVILSVVIVLVMIAIKNYIMKGVL